MIRQFSPKRLAKIKSGEVRRVAGSSFVMSAEQFRAYLVRKKSKARKPVEEGKAPQTRSLGPKTDKQRWKAKADKWFSEFIRLRDSDEHGIATCITSGRRAHWRTMDCGHYISRAKEAVRYDECNAHAQSKQANRFQGGHFMEHGLRIEEKHGRGTVHALEQKAMRPCKRTASDYQFIANTYRSRVEWIKHNEPEKYNSPNRK
jgi:hypothetical protein